MTRDEQLQRGASCNASELAVLKAARRVRDAKEKWIASRGNWNAHISDGEDWFIAEQTNLRASLSLTDDPREPGADSQADDLARLRRVEEAAVARCDAYSEFLASGVLDPPSTSNEQEALTRRLCDAERKLLSAAFAVAKERQG